MIRMIQSSSAAHAKSYFSDALSQSDYYIDGQELQGRFEGSLTKRLGLESSLANKDDFHALCENLHPRTNNQLTPRTKEERTVGYDINFHCPKSVSILHALSKDDHIMEAFKKSVAETMRDIEKDSKTRIRKSGQYDERTTGELLWGEFVHQTARPVEGHAPDPHLHSHCFVFNVTWDKEENRFKAVQFRDIKRDMPYYQALFHKRLSDNMIQLGYNVRKTDKSFEIDGVPKKVVELFSKRTDEIGRVAKEKNITDAKQLGELGAKTRSKKQKGLTMPELKEAWKKQIRELGYDPGDDKAVRFAPKKLSKEITSQDCLDHVISHCFERASVIAERRLLANAFSHSIGHKELSVSAIAEAFKKDERIIEVKERTGTMCTTREVLAEERKMVALAKQGLNKLKPLYQTSPKIKLKGQQLEAVEHVLTTPNRVSIIRGVAGSGKTTLMTEAISHIKKAGKTVMVVAPTSQASRGVLRDEGFKDAQTVSQLLVDKKLQDDLYGQVLWVDEAGLLGTKDMTALLDLATRSKARLILGGDTRQHSSVIRGDALRIINTVGGIKSAEVSKIYRQKNEAYRGVVEDLAKGDIKEAFGKLDKMEFIKKVDPMKPNETLVDDYVQSLKKGKSALVISPTHKQGDEVTEAIRKKLRGSGLLGKRELAATRLTNQNFTDAQKADWRNYQQGQIVQFNQNMPGIKRGSFWMVDEIKDKQVQVKNTAGKSLALDTSHSEKFEVYNKTEIKLSKGDKIFITKNGFDGEKKRLNNGQMLEVTGVKMSGQIKLRNKVSKTNFVLDKEFGHISHAHCITSHAAQGQTVDEVFISQPSGTFGATNAKQFYVSVSRGRDKATVYTDDKEALLQHASEIGNRVSAIELVNMRKDHIDYVHTMQRQEPDRNQQHPERTKQRPSKIINRDYEP